MSAPLPPGADDGPGSVALRRAQVVTAGHRHDVQTARRALTDAEPQIRALALGALQRSDALDHLDLAAGLEDPSPLVRRRTLELIARRSDPVLDPAAALDDPDPVVAETAAWACGEVTARPATVARLDRMARTHSDPTCREAAVAALGALGDPAGVVAVLAATSDKPAIRRRAVVALAAFEGDEVEAAIERALEDRDWQVRQAAEVLLDVGPDHARGTTQGKNRSRSSS